MLHKVTLRSNGDVDEVLVDGERVAMDDGINMDELLHRLSRKLRFVYESERGDWDRKTGEWKPEKKR